MTGAIVSQARALSPAARERRFYFRMAWFVFVLIVLGFGPSFYFKPLGLFSYPRPNPPLIANLMVHGLVFTAWLAVFMVQVTLVSAGRRDLHRKLGAAGMLLGAALIPVMYLTAVWQVERANQPPFTDPLTWTVVPLIGIPALAAMLWLGWRARRHDLQTHKRLMLGVMLLLTEPAIARLPLSPPTWGGFTFQAVLSLLTFVPLIVWDRRTQGRVHPATRLGLGLFAAVVAAQAAFLAVPGVWARFAVMLPGVA